jgi:hypothetical protein
MRKTAKGKPSTSSILIEREPTKKEARLKKLGKKCAEGLTDEPRAEVMDKIVMPRVRAMVRLIVITSERNFHDRMRSYKQTDGRLESGFKRFKSVNPISVGKVEKYAIKRCQADASLRPFIQNQVPG